MLLLITYVMIALGFSFICSIAEAVILSVSNAYIQMLEKSGKKAGKLLAAQSNDINQPLSAILTLNTIAHTMGAAGAGAQAAYVFGDAYLGIISAVLTLLILVFSEIIPKTLGATYWRQLAPVTAYFLKYLIIVLYPFVKMSQKMTAGFTEESPLKGLSRSELHAMAELSGKEGQLAKHEANILKSLMSMHELTIRGAMTHRTKVFSLPQETTVGDFFQTYETVGYSRIPIYEDNDAEKITGFVMRNDLLLAQARQQTELSLSEFNKDMQTLLSSMPLSSTFELFLKNKVHILLIVDEYGGLEGILTLEDLLESILGVQIDDEKDQEISMRELAAGIAQQRQHQYTLKSAKHNIKR